MKALLIDAHLLIPRSRSSANVRVKYQGHVSQKMGVSGAIVFHKHILFSIYFQMSTMMGGSFKLGFVWLSIKIYLQYDFYVFFSAPMAF